MRVPLTPAELGFDARVFPEWRPQQKELLEEVMGSTKEHIIIQAPTGFGKSLFAAALAELNRGQATHYLVTTKSLQEQVQREFQHIFSMWGRNMHQCVLLGREDDSVDQAICNFGFKCPVKDTACHYYLQLGQAREARVLVTNYFWYWYNNTYGESFGYGPDHNPPGLLICDEADSIESAIMNFASIEISRHEADVLGLGMPKPETLHTWLDSADQITRNRKEYFEKEVATKYGETIAENNDEAFELMRSARGYEDLLGRIEAMRNGWRDFAHLYVVVMEKDSFAIRPIVATMNARALIHQAGVKKVYMSGTILDKEGFCRELAIDPAEADFFDMASTFDASRRPLILHDVVGLNSRNIDNQLEQLTDWVDGLIDAYEGQKGIVHTANYRIAQHILRHSSNRDILIGHRPDNRMVAIRHFKSRKGSAVIVSPSLVRGEDFPGFHCRWQAIVKAPYPNIMDPQVKARMDMEPAWLDRVTMRSIIQAYGRGMRSEDDSCDTHGYDANIGKLFWRARSIVPGYVRSAIVQKGKEDAA